MIANLREILDVIELVGTILCTWPIDPNASKCKSILLNIYWMFAVFSVGSTILCLLITTYYFRHDLILLTKTTCFISALSETLLDLIICKMSSKKLQVLIEKVRKYLDTTGKDENNMIQVYVKRYKTFFSTMAVAYFINGVSFFFMPLYTNQHLPLESWLPFSTDTVMKYGIVYIIQAYSSMHTALSIFVDFKIISLLCFTAARLDILNAKLKQGNSYEMMVNYIKEHQEILRFLEDTKAAVQALLFKTNITMGSVVIAAAFPLLYMKNPMSEPQVVYQFVCMVLAGCGHVYLISAPSDDLKESSIQFAMSVTDIQWIGKQKNMTTSVLIMLQRSQKPCLIPLGLIPPLSMEYFSQFLTTIYSYFMAIRTMIES
ncbi:odorant receptor 13a-like [Osmia lignaria lignaria]|uniref:odorant receptor 13a-like n=1 Tax=Osmia lignaria lignaria TaxID=1437193 RepID=UPI00402B34C7